MYYGNGRRAQQAYEHDRQHQEAKARERAIRQSVHTLNADTTTLTQKTDTLIKAHLLTAGYHQHHRSEWRKRRIHTIIQEGDTMPIMTTAAPEIASFETLEALVHQAALLRCRCIDFSIPEYFGGRDM
jgi:hypothetical protein